MALRERHDLYIFDIMLSGLSGLNLLKSLRQAGQNTPTIILSALNQLGDRLEGLRLGADDYLTKPFYVEELHARILAIARRTTGEREHFINVGYFKLDRIGREAFLNSKAIDLSSREFSLLEYLMRSPGQIFTRSQILEHVWGYDFDPSSNVVDVCIKRIRSKIAAIDDYASRTAIEAIRGTGYRFRASNCESK